MNDIRKYLKEKGIKTKKYLDFFEEYINNGGNARQAYKTIISPNVTDASASVLANRLFKKVNFEEVMAMAGLGTEAIMEALHKLKQDDPKEFVKYYDKFVGLSKPETINVNHTIDSVKDKLESLLEDE